MSKSKIAASKPKSKRKEVMTQIFTKLSDALKEYATPRSEKKIAKELKKTSKVLSDLTINKHK